MQGHYIFPPISLLERPVGQSESESNQIEQCGSSLLRTLDECGLSASLGNIFVGPGLIRFEVILGRGVRVERIMSLKDDLALAARSSEIRIVMVPSAGAVGIEVLRPHPEPVYLVTLLESKAWSSTNVGIPIALGSTEIGMPIIEDLTTLPHILIGGSTGAGKTTSIDSIVASILFARSPSDVRFVIVGEKAYDLAVFGKLPHMLAPVASSGREIVSALDWLLNEMETRLEFIATAGVRNINSLNALRLAGNSGKGPLQLPYIVVFIDEIGDIIQLSPEAISPRLLALINSGAVVGIHLVATITPRPSADIVPAKIRSRFPARLSFLVPSHWDSRTILGVEGAEQLKCPGDMLYVRPGNLRPHLAKGTYVREKEIAAIADFLNKQDGRSG